MITSTTPPSELQRTSGAGAAALLPAGIGSFTLRVLTTGGYKCPAIKAGLVFYKPTGALSGVTTIAVATWLASWALLQLLWSRKQVLSKEYLLQPSASAGSSAHLSASHRPSLIQRISLCTSGQDCATLPLTALPSDFGRRAQFPVPS